ncbi:hypothetical protein SEA_PHRIEDRICE_26 [Microbacterium phage PhriedRice]|uniref:Uncharacterized protein n=1 Tax=Microbacterium phage PhriedRice TaxID=2652407 RepID=A0A5J6T4J7_9CAUD|nr:hypothetical protein SEA_PHRIEDRICE_26 [Microbacterium phage PhriedRice]
MTSLGQLKHMSPSYRKTYISKLKRAIRLRLIYLAVLGMNRAFKQAEEYAQLIQELSDENEKES